MSHPFDLKNKIFLVTGASSGIGQATAIVLSSLGAKLILVGRDAATLEATRQQLQACEMHHIAPFDLQQSALLSDWMRETVSFMGALHGMVHCAGIHMIKPLKLIEPQDYQRLFETNVGMAVNVCKAFCQKTVSLRPSSIVFISSVAGIQGQAGISTYAATKGALIALSKSLAMELASEKIRVNCVAPGVVETPMTEKLFAKMTEDQIKSVKEMHPLGLGRPEDVAHAISFLLSDAARWITGTTLTVDGGYCTH